MLKTMLLVIATLISVMLTSNDFSLAQTGSETDPRFEKLAKDLYPKAKQEGVLVVYTIWDVDHIRFILAAFNKRFPGHVWFCRRVMLLFVCALFRQVV